MVVKHKTHIPGLDLGGGGVGNCQDNTVVTVVEN